MTDFNVDLVVLVWRRDLVCVCVCVCVCVLVCECVVVRVVYMPSEQKASMDNLYFLKIKLHQYYCFFNLPFSNNMVKHADMNAR